MFSWGAVGSRRRMHAHDLLQFLHQLGLVLQSSGGVGQQHVEPACPCRLDGVVDHGGRVSAGLLGDHRHLVAFTPDLQLLDGRRTIGVAGCEHDLAGRRP